jgi:hypothetical protein
MAKKSTAATPHETLTVIALKLNAVELAQLDTICTRQEIPPSRLQAAQYLLRETLAAAAKTKP